MAAPGTLDVLSRFMADNFDESLILNEPCAFQRVFGRPEAGNSFTHFSPNANDLDIEITRADEKTAAVVPRGTMASFVGTNFGLVQVGQSTFFSRKYPLIVDESAISADQINNRMPYGEGPYENLSREVRLQRYAIREMRIMEQRTMRAFERLAVQSVTLGKQSATPGFATPGANDYDWRRNSSNSVTLTHGWAYSSATTPLTDIDSLCFQIRAAGHVRPDVMVLGATAMSAFMFNTQIVPSTGVGGAASKIYFDYIQFSANFKADPKYDGFIKCGLIPMGKLRTPGGFDLTLFEYPEYYIAANGTATKYLNDLYAVIFCSSARADRYFGPPEQLPMTSVDQQRLVERFGFNPMLPPLPVNKFSDDGVFVPQMLYVDGYENGNRTGFTPRIQAAPVFATTMTDAFGVILNAGSSS